MADTTDHGPGRHPDAVKINEDGTPDTGGRTGWVWMEDPSTGGRFDVHTSRAAWQVARGATVVEGYPANYGRSARTPKAAVGKDGGRPAPPTSGQETSPLPASALGAVEPADERQPDDTPDDTPDGEPAAETAPDDQAAAGGTQPKPRKAGRTR
jgi:hypothetical protein